MQDIKIFKQKDLVLKVNDKNFDPIKYPLDEWERFLDVLCQNREYQKDRMLEAKSVKAEECHRQRR